MTNPSAVDLEGVIEGLEVARDALARAPHAEDLERAARDRDYYPDHEALCELVSLQNEHWALNGGGPSWQKRWDAALAHAADLVRVEP